MKIGIFDSGLGGLLVAKAIRKVMPEYDYVYLGDTKRVPYGNRSYETVYEFTKEGIDYLFKKENCAIVILACNTASARALRRLQEEYLAQNFPKRKILGVLIPSAEEAVNFKRVGVLATQGTVSSHTFINEIHKLNKNIKVFQNPAPMLVTLAEEGENKLAVPFLVKYLKPLLDKKIDALVLGCTHYPIFKNQIKKLIKEYTKKTEARLPFGKNVKIISQDEIIPKKLKEYFSWHKEIEKKLSKKGNAHSNSSGQVKILVTDFTQNIEKLSKKWFGKNIKPELVGI